jgi:transcriptional regulator with XRE-family HTH domain
MVHNRVTTSSGGSDDHLLQQLGARLARERLRRNWTQEELAEEAGLSRSTLRRLEAGESTQMVAFLRVLRALGLAANLEKLIPEAEATPLERLVEEKRSGRRRRASRRRRKEKRGGHREETGQSSDGWIWGEDR